MARTAEPTPEVAKGVIAGALDAMRTTSAVSYPPCPDWEFLKSKPGKTSRPQTELLADATAEVLHKIFGEIEFGFVEVIPEIRNNPHTYHGRVLIQGVNLRVNAILTTGSYGDEWVIKLHGDYVNQGVQHSILVTDDVSFAFAAIAQDKVAGRELLQPVDR